MDGTEKVKPISPEDFTKRHATGRPLGVDYKALVEDVCKRVGGNVAGQITNPMNLLDRIDELLRKEQAYGGQKTQVNNPGTGHAGGE